MREGGGGGGGGKSVLLYSYKPGSVCTACT